PTGNVNEYTVTYQVTITNTSEALAFYDLRDTLKYGDGASIISATASYVSGDMEQGTSNYTNFDGQTDYVITEEEQIGSGEIEIYQVIVVFGVNPEQVTPTSADCVLEDGETGTGLLNSAGVSGGVPSKWDDDCSEI